MNTSTELSLPQRAAVALGTAEHEVKLIALAKESTDITAVIDPAGRDQAHRVGMTLRNTRTNISKIGKAARDDATAFGKAVIAEEKRLVAIIEPEELRIIKLRDEFDAQVQAEKDAKIAAERARIERIADAIAALREGETDALRICKTAEAVRLEIEYVEAKVISEEIYQERHAEALEVQASVLASMRATLASRIEAEAEAARQQAEREAAEAKAKQEREELAAAQAKLKADQEAAAAELKRQQAETAAEMQRQRDALAAEMKAEREKAEALRKLEDDKRRLEQQEREKQEKAQQAAMDARQRDLDHAEGLMLNAQFDQLAAAQRLEKETAEIAMAGVAESVTIDVVEEPQEPNLFANLVESKPMDGDRAELHRPTDEEIVKLISDHFNVKAAIAYCWLCELSHDIEYF